MQEIFDSLFVTIQNCPTSGEFYVGAFFFLLLGLAAGSQIPRLRSIGSRRPKRRPGSPNMIEIYVGNLSYETDENQLRAIFEKYGTVKSARIISNHFNNKSKGFGFIEMPNRPEAEAAINALNDTEIQGRKLRVNEARNKLV